ncbi:MAG: hypothetical protein ACI3ZP_00155 [Candidatus Cryptobacteroides sp.]
MNRIFIATAALAMLTAVSSMAQEPSSQDFKARYETMVSKLGPAGVGIETLINKWEAAYPEDLEMLAAKFSYCFNKAQATSVEVKDAAKYLGEQPVLTLKDTTGNDINYFQVTSYDDELFGQAQKAIDKAIQIAPDRLDLRFLKTASLIGYEKESPDMALSSLKGLVDYNFTRHPKWEYPGVEKVDDEFFVAAIQEYCYLFFKYGTPTSFEAFRQLSEKMAAYRPSDVLFLDNLGSYYLVVAKDNKAALKYYNKVLKIKPDDMTAIKNAIILARNAKDAKLEKKYLPMMIKYSEDAATKMSAEKRLEFLNGSK